MLKPPYPFLLNEPFHELDLKEPFHELDLTRNVVDLTSDVVDRTSDVVDLTKWYLPASTNSSYSKESILPESILPESTEQSIEQSIEQYNEEYIEESSYYEYQVTEEWKQHMAASVERHRKRRASRRRKEVVVEKEVVKKEVNVDYARFEKQDQQNVLDENALILEREECRSESKNSLELKASLNARFDDYLVKYSPVYWPSLPLHT